MVKGNICQAVPLKLETKLKQLSKSLQQEQVCILIRDERFASSACSRCIKETVILDSVCAGPLPNQHRCKPVL